MGFAISRKIIRSGRARWLYQLRTLTAKENSMRHLKFVVNCALVFSSVGAFAQDSARTVQYHSQDIVPIRAKVKYTTLIELPTTEKIMEAATGDKEFWIVDVVGNFCFVHPAKQGISSNLNLITDKGNIYSFTLQDISGPNSAPSRHGGDHSRPSPRQS
jgi:type IV secretion system protein VirB9